MNRLLSLAVLAVVLAFIPTLQAQQYPTKSIRIIVPFPPGDSLDTMSRLIAPKILERLGQGLVVDNRVGAAGQLGLELGARTPKHIVDLLNREINRAMMAPDVKEKLEAIGLTVVAESPEQFAQVLKSDYEKYGKLIKAINFQPQ